MRRETLLRSEEFGLIRDSRDAITTGATKWRVKLRKGRKIRWRGRRAEIQTPVRIGRLFCWSVRLPRETVRRLGGDVPTRHNDSYTKCASSPLHNIQHVLPIWDELVCDYRDKLGASLTHAERGLCLWMRRMRSFAGMLWSRKWSRTAITCGNAI